VVTPATQTETLTIDELASAARTTTRSIRSFQTLGLMPRPDLHGRTGVYGAGHRQRLEAILHLQSQGFSLQSLAVLFTAFERGESLGAVLGLDERSGTAPADAGTGTDEAELYGFGELLQNPSRRPGQVRPLLAIVPSTLWDETEAS
jgi:DNA-binding transcriptional MerR regulator